MNRAEQPGFRPCSSCARGFSLSKCARTAHAPRCKWQSMVTQARQCSLHLLHLQYCCHYLLPSPVPATVLVVPAACRKLVLKTSHDLPVSGHFSHRRTEMKICDKFWWPGLSSDVRRYCKSCDSCQRMSARGRTRRVAMVTMPIISTPFERVAIDIVGPLSPPTRGGHRYILTIIDYATSFIEAVPLKRNHLCSYC